MRNYNALFGLSLAIGVCAALGALVARAQAPSPTVTFQVEVDYVDVDVVVTDEQGHFVRGLTRDDFEVSEDSKPVKIDTFATVQIPIERHDSKMFGGRAISEDVRSNRALLTGRFYVIVLDDVGTSPLRSQYVIRAARQFMEQHFAVNDTAAVVYTSGRRERAQDFTTDRNLLLTSIDKFAGTKLRSSTLDKLDGYYQQKLIEEAPAAQNDGQPVGQDSAQLRQVNPFSKGEGYPNRSYDLNDIERGRRALGVLGQIKSYADFLTNVRGRRKAMVLFSEGIDYPVHDIFSAHDATTVLGAMKDAVAAAAKANVNIFAVDPRGLAGLTSEYIELNKSNADLFNIASRDPRYGLQPQTALLAEMRTTQDSLRTLSEETGGLASIDANSLTNAFDRIVEANSVYYMIGYYPPTHPRDGRFHPIEVRVKRAGLRVTARKGYVTPRVRPSDNRDRAARERLARTKGADQTSRELREALDKPLPQGGLRLAVQGAPFKGNAKTASVVLAIDIDGASLPFTPQKDIFANKVEVSLFSIDQQGKPLQGIRQELDLALRRETYERVTQHGLRINPRVELPPGNYQVRVGVREAGGGISGTVFYDLAVPDFTRDRLSISGLLISAPSAQQTLAVQAQQEANQSAAAATSRRTFDRSDVVRLYAEIYTNNAPPGQIDVNAELVDEAGRAVSVSRETSSSGLKAFTFAKELPLKDVAPGRYLLLVEAQLRGSEADAKPVTRETLITVR